ncbi:MAG TPA: hypothetical protein VIM14_15230 [Polyangia bacterium]
MMFLSRSVIALSMMVVVAAVAPNSARAADAEAGASAQVPSEAAPAPADESATGKEPSEHTSKHRAKPAAVGAAAGEESPRFFGGPAQSSHKFQTGLSIMPGSGYRLIVPYKEAQFCADSSGQGTKRVCAHSVPIFLDFQLAFGVAARADAIVDVRFGLQSDPATGGNHQFALAPGLRFWLDQEVALKFYTTLQFVYDYTDFSNNPGVRSSDYGVRNANGLMYDPIRNVGFFVQFAETIGFARWFRIDLDIGLGAQIRFP